jgi:hypothetical protein
MGDGGPWAASAARIASCAMVSRRPASGSGRRIGGGAGATVSLSPSCEAALAGAPWPGNLRQLAACLKALAALAEPDGIETAGLGLRPAHRGRRGRDGAGGHALGQGVEVHSGPAPTARPAP